MKYEAESAIYFVKPQYPAMEMYSHFGMIHFARICFQYE